VMAGLDGASFGRRSRNIRKFFGFRHGTFSKRGVGGRVLNTT
jgi:hypothetical protein